MPEPITAVRQVLFAAESRGDPLAAFPSLTRQDRPYNLWLTEQVLDPILDRWLGLRDAGADPVRGVADDFAWISRRCRGAFQEVLPSAISAGDPALLAAMGVTANLQRTAALLGEFLAAGGKMVAGDPAIRTSAFRLSRLWCGLIEYPEGAAYFPARVHPPVHASRLNIRRHDFRHVANALWCSLSSISSRCEEATVRLREAIVRSGLFEPGDLRHLRGPSVSLRSRGRK